MLLATAKISRQKGRICNTHFLISLFPENKHIFRGKWLNYGLFATLHKF